MHNQLMKRVAAGFCAVFLATCGGSNGFSSSTPTSGVAPDLQARFARSLPREVRHEFVYVTNGGSDNVSAYSVDQLNGALIKVHGSPFLAGQSPVAVAVDSASKFAYVVNQHYPHRYGNISGYTIDATTGALARVSGSPFLSGNSPYNIAISGRYLYVPCIFSDNVVGYTIQTTGALKKIGDFGPDAQPEGLAVDPSGSFVYVTNSETNNVTAYAINYGTGELKRIANYKADTTPEFPAVDPSGTYLYVPNTNANDISAYRINSNSGRLTKISGSPFAGGVNPRGVAIDPQDKFAYVTDPGGDDISGYKIDPSSGALTQVQGSPFAAGAGPDQLVTSASGKFVYAANTGSNNISAYRINQFSGALRQVPGSPFAAGTGPTGITAARI